MWFLKSVIRSKHGAKNVLNVDSNDHKNKKKFFNNKKNTVQIKHVF